MCTAITFQNKDFYFGRNLDLGCSLGEQIVITPRNYPLPFRREKTLFVHYAMLGVAYVPDQYPLYYDATNERGLSMAGLNFPEYADYKEFVPSKNNVTPFEFIPWILGQCASVKEALIFLEKLNLYKEAYSSSLPLSPLHWIISDRDTSIVVESVKDNLKLYDNPAGVLTNAPAFDTQLQSLQLDKDKLSGSWNSEARFSRAFFVKTHSAKRESELEAVHHFFHILGSVEQPLGCTRMPTQYSSCCNTDRGIYYYNTYDNSQISAVNMYHTDLNAASLTLYPLQKEPRIFLQN